MVALLCLLHLGACLRFPSPAPRHQYRVRVRVEPSSLRLCDAAGETTGDIAGPATDAKEAARILGLGPYDSDLVSYLRAGRTLLARRVSVVLPDCDVLRECLLIAAEKFVRLGASVEVLTDLTVRGASEVPWSAKVPFPRCVVRPVNLTSIAELAGALQGASALVLSTSHLPDGGAEALAAALPLAGVSTAPADGGSGEPRQPLASETGSASTGVQQMVLLSSAHAGGTRGTVAALPMGGGEGAEQEACEDDESLLRRSSDASTAVLRACTLFGDDGAAAANSDSLFSDASGLHELLEEYLVDLRALSSSVTRPARGQQRQVDEERSGEAGGEEAGSKKREDDDDESDNGECDGECDGDGEWEPPSMATLLPPAETEVQFTHTIDLAGACVFAVLAGLDDAYDVCAAPLTLQQLFDRLARRKEWEPITLRAGGGKGRSHKAKGGGSTPSVPSSDKIEQAGYVMMWPDLAVDQPARSQPSLEEVDEYQRGVEAAADEPPA